jgi:Arc/MetJ-type ribon-helix-helix transcriptional regulator
MKLSVSLPDEDIEFLDEYARSKGYRSRSAVLRRAVRLLRSTELGDAYAEAWTEWAESGEAELWESAAADGLTGP